MLWAVWSRAWILEGARAFSLQNA